MILDLRRIFKSDGAHQAIDYHLDFSDYEFNHYHPFRHPVVVKGEINNSDGFVTVKFNINTKTHFLCDRCLDEFEDDYAEEFEHILFQNEDTQKDNYIFVNNAKLDLDELVVSDIILSLPYKILCKEDCKGICPNCWQNLNVSDCKCENMN